MSPSPILLIVDNRDSFTWNIAQLASTLDASVSVVENSEITEKMVKDGGYTHIIIGPGPMGPKESKQSLNIIKEFSGKLPILGICLGLQALVLLDGGDIIPHDLLHGGQDEIIHTGEGVHVGIQSPFRAARYNSLSVTVREQGNLMVTAKNRNGTIMAVRHKKDRFTEGVQYHPESFMTAVGSDILTNFLAYSYITS